MPNDINEMKKFVNNVKKLVEKKVNNAKTDTSKKAIVQSLNEDGTANIIINGKVYNNVKIRAGLQPQINEVVLVSIPNNNTKDMFIDLASSTSTSGGETNHTHSNLSILETITQALINAWNSAVSHISDAVKHITSDERNLWNTVSNKVDKIEGKGLSTEDYTTAEKNKLSGITNNATRVESSSINGNIKINDTETNVYTHPNDSSTRHVTDAEKATWNNKLDSSEATTAAMANKLLRLDNNAKLPASITGNADGNAATATKLQTARIISLTGDVSGSTSFDGSSDKNISVTLSNSGVTAGTYSKVTVDTKGRVTSGTTLSTSDIPNLDWNKITTGKPTTLSGYGITDATPSSHIGSTGSAHGVATTSVNGFMSSTDKLKLDGIANNATRVESSPTNGNIKINGVETNVYTHPSNHNANIIIEDSTHRFVTDVEKNTWNNKQNSLENLPTIYNVASDDTFIVKQSSDGVFKKVSKADFLASVNPDEFVFLVKREEFTATEGQTVFNLTKGYYVPNNNRISVYIWGNKQPNTAFSETSSTSVVLLQPVEAGTKVLIEWFQLINVIDYVHASTHAINGEDPITPAMIGAETPENAQQKANQAEANAKAYTDNKTTTYIHYQTSPSNNWIINHNLTKYPSVTIVDSAGNVVIGDVKYIDNNTINVVFVGTFSGIAYLN